MNTKIQEYLTETSALAKEWGISPGTIAEIQAETLKKWIDEDSPKVDLRIYETLDEIEWLERKEKDELEYNQRMWKAGEPYWFRSFSAERLKRYAQRISKLRASLYFMSRRGQTKGGVTPEMIARAKNYDWSKLLEFRNGKALCPFHDDHNPSFSVKNGWGRCFGCGKTLDTIGFVMETRGLSFPEAVKKLADDQSSI